MKFPPRLSLTIGIVVQVLFRWPNCLDLINMAFQEYIKGAVSEQTSWFLFSSLFQYYETWFSGMWLTGQIQLKFSKSCVQSMCYLSQGLTFKIWKATKGNNSLCLAPLINNSEASSCLVLEFEFRKHFAFYKGSARLSSLLLLYSSWGWNSGFVGNGSHWSL